MRIHTEHYLYCTSLLLFFSGQILLCLCCNYLHPRSMRAANPRDDYFSTNTAPYNFARRRELLPLVT